MAEKKFIIEVRTKGFARANRNFKQLNTDGKKYVETTKRMRRSTAGLEASLGSLRNRLLVNAFAIAAVTKAAQGFFRSAVEFEDVKARLVGLTGSVEGAEFAFKKLNQVAATTPFQLGDVVNAGAQLEAFGASATDTIKPITDLAAFMGTTATEAANAFGRAYAGGAGAADILRERGVLNIIKSFKGIEDLSKITLPEFREALLGALVDPTVGIEGSSERMSKTFSGAMSNMLDSLSRLTAAISSRFLPSITDMVKGITNLSNAGVQLFTSVDMTQTDPFGTRELSGRLSTLTIKDIPKLREEIAKAEADFTKLQKKREQQPLLPGMIEPVQFEQFDLSINTSQAEESTKSFQILLGDQQVALDQTGVKILDLGTGIAGLVNPLENVEQAIQSQIQVSGILGDEIDIQEEKLNKLKETLKDLEELEQKRNATLREEIQGQIQRNASIAGRLALQEQTLKQQKEEEKTLSIFNNLFTQTDEGQRRNIETTRALMEANKELIISQNNISEADFKSVIASLSDELQNLGEKNINLNNIFTQIAGSINVLSSSMKALGDESATAAQKNAALLKTMGGLMMTLGAGTPISGVGAVLSAFGGAIGHTGGYIKQDGSIQRFATGGMVQGQDNVPILAQAGEFIMQRSAVQNIGVQNLADMNRTGSAGGVTINIQGNMIGNDEFVRDNLIPQLKQVSDQNLA